VKVLLDMFPLADIFKVEINLLSAIAFPKDVDLLRIAEFANPPQLAKASINVMAPMRGNSPFRGAAA